MKNPTLTGGEFPRGLNIGTKICNNCKHKICLKTLKCCKKVESFLPKINSGRVKSINKQRYEEIPYDMNTLELKAIYRAFELKGQKLRKINYNF